MEAYTSERLEEMLCKELDEIAKKGKLTAGDLDTVHKLTDTIKNLEKIEMYSEGGYSMDGDWEARGSYDRGNSYSRNSYEGGNSMARRRDSRGRYSRRMYSRDDGMEEITEKIEEMMQEVSGQDREILRQAMMVLKK